jgi:hypothetical protein
MRMQIPDILWRQLRRERVKENEFQFWHGVMI